MMETQLCQVWKVLESEYKHASALHTRETQDLEQNIGDNMDEWKKNLLLSQEDAQYFVKIFFSYCPRTGHQLLHILKMK